jgi:hypothetical protein
MPTISSAGPDTQTAKRPIVGANRSRTGARELVVSSLLNPANGAGSNGLGCLGSIAARQWIVVSRTRAPLAQLDRATDF